MRKLLIPIFLFISSILYAGGAIDCPILIYHTIRPYKTTDTPFIKEYVCTPEAFDTELAYLREKGYHAISFAELESHFSQGTPLPIKPIIISFDDGWESQYQYALPILQKYAFKATFFIYTNAIGKKYHLTWDEITALDAKAMEIGSHSMSHPILTRMNSVRLKQEIFQSKQIIEDHLKKPVVVFAYPFGQYNAQVIKLVKAAGYLCARGTFLGNKHTQKELYTLRGIIRTNSVQIYEQELK